MKKQNIQKKRILMSATAVGMCSALVAGSIIPASAAQTTDRLKDENVYATLAEDGTVTGAYVVNEYTSKTDGKITDYGDYSSVKNLTTNETIEQNGDQISVTVPKGKFYYQGNLKTTDIPWNISISYTLDGKKISAEDLAGKSGKLKIHISVKENTNCDSKFFDNYLLQATVVLDTEKCSNIVATGATAGNVGEDRQLLYNIMAGQEKDIEISADVEDFEMDGITFKGVLMGFDVDSDSIDTSELTDKTDEIKDAVSELDDGAGQIKDATETAEKSSKELNDGALQLANGIRTFRLSGMDKLSSGASELGNGSNQLSQGITTYTAGVGNLADGIRTYIAGVETLGRGANALQGLSGLGAVSDGITQMTAQVNGSGSQTLAGGSAQLTAGLKELKNQVDALAASGQVEKVEALLAQSSTLQESLTALAEQSESLSQLLGADTQMAQAIVSEHQSVMTNLSSQVAQANQEIQDLQDQAAAGNTKADQAIEKVSELENEGKLTSDEASTLKNAIADTKVDAAAANQDISITMPQEDAAIQQQAAQLAASAETLQTASAGFSQAAAQMKQMADACAEMQNMDLSATVNQLQTAVTAAYEGSQSLQQGIGQLGVGLTTLQENTSTFPQAAQGIVALNQGFAQLQSNDQTLLNGSAALKNSGSTLNSGAASLQQGINSLQTGISSAAAGVDALQQGANTLQSGTSEFSSGMKDLNDGATELKDGTQEFKDETSDIDTQIDDAIDEMIEKLSGSDYEPVSFTSDENTDIGLVQFAIRTDDIKVKEAEETPAVEKKQTILDKIKGLFQ